MQATFGEQITGTPKQHARLATHRCVHIEAVMSFWLANQAGKIGVASARQLGIKN